MPRVLRGVAERDRTTTVLGERVALPVLLAPVGCHRLFHPEGELAVARAAAEAGTIFVVSTAASISLEEIAAEARAPLWFQLYAFRDRDLVRRVVERAAAAGYRALCATVDSPIDGRRERDLRNGFIRPPEFIVKMFRDLGFAQVPEGSDAQALLAYAGAALDPAITWEYLEWLQAISPLPLVVKGILSPEDARRAVDLGARAIVVSNHGGRQLDGAPASVDTLPAIAAAVGGHAEILLDGGVRRGTDVLKAIALGARAVLVGRPYIWGLAITRRLRRAPCARVARHRTRHRARADGLPHDCRDLTRSAGPARGNREAAMKSPIGLGITGSGFMGLTHAEAASLVEETKLIAVAGGSRAPKLAGQYRVAVEPDVAALVRRSDIDAVVITTRTMSTSQRRWRRSRPASTSWWKNHSLPQWPTATG